MTKSLVNNKFKIPGLDNYSLKQQNEIGEEITREELMYRINEKLDKIISLLMNISNKL